MAIIKVGVFLDWAEIVFTNTVSFLVARKHGAVFNCHIGKFDMYLVDSKIIVCVIFDS